MEEFLKKGTVINLIWTLLLLIIGIILVVNPVVTLSVVTYSLEIILITWGIITIVNFVRVESKYDVFSLGFVQGVACILLALFLIVNPTIIITILPICIGILMVISSLSRMQVAIKLSAWGQRTSLVYIFLAIIMFVVGLAVICNPFTTAAVFVRMLGTGIIVYSVIDIIQGISIIRFLNNMDI